MNTALARTNSSSPSLSRRKNGSEYDRGLQEAIKSVSESRREFTELNDYIRRILSLPRRRTRSWLARSLRLVIPQRFYGRLPTPMIKMIAEEFDALEAAEGEYRKRVNNIQLATKNLTGKVREKGEELLVLEADLERAKAENWNARQLHEFILEKAGLEVDEEISTLLDDKFNVIGEEEKESRKQRLLKQLDGNITLGKSLVRAGVKACYASLETFEGAAGEYYNYVNVYRPAAAIRDTAETLVEASDVVHAGREAIATTLEVSFRAIDNALETARQCRNHSIVSVEMQKLLETGSRKIDDKLKLLAAEDRKRLTAVTSQPVKQLVESVHVIDVETVPYQQ